MSTSSAISPTVAIVVSLVVTIFGVTVLGLSFNIKNVTTVPQCINSSSRTFLISVISLLSLLTFIMMIQSYHVYESGKSKANALFMIILTASMLAATIMMGYVYNQINVNDNGVSNCLSDTNLSVLRASALMAILVSSIFVAISYNASYNMSLLNYQVP